MDEGHVHVVLSGGCGQEQVEEEGGTLADAGQSSHVLLDLQGGLGTLVVF